MHPVEQAPGRVGNDHLPHDRVGIRRGRSPSRRTAALYEGYAAYSVAIDRAVRSGALDERDAHVHPHGNVAALTARRAGTVSISARASATRRGCTSSASRRRRPRRPIARLAARARRSKSAAVHPVRATSRRRPRRRSRCRPRTPRGRRAPLRAAAPARPAGWARAEPQYEPPVRALLHGGPGHREQRRRASREGRDARGEADVEVSPASAASVTRVSREPTSGRNSASNPAASAQRASPARSSHRYGSRKASPVAGRAPGWRSRWRHAPMVADRWTR